MVHILTEVPWQLVQEFAKRKEVGLKRIHTLMRQAFHVFPQKMRVGTMNLKTGGIGQSQTSFFLSSGSVYSPIGVQTVPFYTE